ncbi:hypothetical protein B0O99DRAFT_690727 [Bisporella sp. PMI_857]|nr:hypothetical protein B0O99DRAFT_690727 [Bisporella sp. PMI_857]
MALPTKALSIGYDTGHGDFWFGRSIDCGIPKPFRAQYDIGEMDCIFQELDGYQRRGIFPLAKLPPELRDRILELTLEPLLIDFGHGGKRYLSVNVVPNTDHKRFKLLEFQGDYTRYCIWYDTNDELAQKVQGIMQAITGDTVFPPYRWWQGHPFQHVQDKLSEEEFHLTQTIISHVSRQHPFRCSQYKMYVLQSRQPSTSSSAGNIKIGPQFIPQIANISAAFRNDFGRVLWSKVHLNIAIDEVRCFLQGRPAVHTAIKSLHLNITETYNRERLASNVGALTCLSGLDHLRVSLHIRKEDIMDIAEAKGLLHYYLRILRVMHVKNTFELDIDFSYAFITVTTMIEFPAISRRTDIENELKPLRKKYIPIFEDLMTPDSLRSSVFPVGELHQ